MSDGSATRGGTTETAGADQRAASVFVVTLGRALRARQLYEGTGASFDRFLDTLRERTVALWDLMPELTVTVEETRLLRDGEVLHNEPSRSDSLAFLLYRDGIRELKFLPGIEDEELPQLLAVLGRVQRGGGREEDDLITLLWDLDLTHLEYRYVDVLEDDAGLAMDPGEGGAPEPVEAETVRAEVEAAPVGTVSTEDFRETLYFLDEHELRRLRKEIETEGRRDLWADVFSALFDQLEIGPDPRRTEVSRILCEMLPVILSHGRVALAGEILRELVPRAGSESPLSDEARGEVRSAMGSLATEETIAQLVMVLEESEEEIPARELGGFLEHLPADALAPLLRAGGSVTRPRLRATLEAATETLARRHPDPLARLLDDPDDAMVAGAVRLLGRIAPPGAVRLIRPTLSHPSPAVRRNSVEVLQGLRTAEAARALIGALRDDDRDVRVLAIRALGTLRFAPALETFREILSDRRIREVDLTERVTFFEVFGTLAGEEDVDTLDGILNGKSWLGRRDPPELRACAALALGRIRHPHARGSLEGAAQTTDPVVRNAVGKALEEFDRG